jgi:hypothetical protein
MGKPTSHYLPAAFIGGFGVRRPELRESSIRVRFLHQQEKTHRMSAEKIARQNRAYELQDPAPNVDPNIIDKIWDFYEPRLPAAVAAFESGSWTADDWDLLVFHMAAQGVRHPDFLNQANRHMSGQGKSPSPDDLQMARVTTLSNLPNLLAKWRFLRVTRASEGWRFVVNDKGFAPVIEEDAQRGVFFSLSANVGVLGAVDAGSPTSQSVPAPTYSRELVPGSVELLNQAMWRTGAIRCAIGHPDDHERLMRLDATRQLLLPCLGAFRNRGLDGLFDW